jgi:hypothetical protein
LFFIIIITIIVNLENHITYVQILSTINLLNVTSKFLIILISVLVELKQYFVHNL